MFTDQQALYVQLAICFALWLVFGIATAAMGRSFWWGFIFGPLGMLIAAILKVSDQPKKQTIIVVNGSPNKRIKLVRHVEAERIAAPSRPYVRSTELEHRTPLEPRPTGRFKRPSGSV